MGMHGSDGVWKHVGVDMQDVPQSREILHPTCKLNYNYYVWCHSRWRKMCEWPQERKLEFDKEKPSNWMRTSSTSSHAPCGATPSWLCYGCLQSTPCSHCTVKEERWFLDTSQGNDHTHISCTIHSLQMLPMMTTLRYLPHNCQEGYMFSIMHHRAS